MDIIAYHADCPDGFCSAFIAAKQWPNAKLVPVTHGQAPPFDLMKENRVLVVDFSWKRHFVEQLYEATYALRVLDHHKTAEAELEGLNYCTFDMNRSGAQMTWDYCHPIEAAMQREKQLRSFRPWYVDYVADRDLWKFELPDSKIINAFIMALPHTIDDWSILDKIGTNQAKTLGEGCRMQIDHYIEKVTAQSYPGRIDSHKCAVVNAAYPNISDVLNELCRKAEIGLGWFIRGDGMMQFSLRSIGDLDVSVIAKSYGGGGHRNASGFQVNQDTGLELLNAVTEAARIP